jgi:hypothetical protein
MGIEQQLKELEKRRKRGMRLLAEGLWPAEVARRVGVTRQSVLRWTNLKEQGGVEALKRPERFGRPRAGQRYGIDSPGTWAIVQRRYLSFQWVAIPRVELLNCHRSISSGG